MKNQKLLAKTIVIGIVAAMFNVWGGVNISASTTYLNKTASGEISKKQGISVIAKKKITLTGLSLLDEFKQSGSVISPTDQQIGIYEPFNNSRSVSTMGVSAPVQKHVTELDAFIELQPDGSASKLEELGLEVRTDLGSIVIVSLPLERMEEIAALPWVKLIDFGGVCEPQNDLSRQLVGITAIHNGIEVNGKTFSFDGSGVVCGMVDIGFDPNHINFRTPSGESRVKRLWHLNASTNEISEYTSDNISSFVTDDVKNMHATHVAGTMAGGYKDKAAFIQLPNPDNTSNAKMHASSGMPYYGVATGADLAVAVGSLGESYIISAVDKIMSYAEAEGKPVVVNISASTSLGPHDGTDAFTKSLNQLAQRGIICVCAGNDANYPLRINKTFTETDNYALVGVSTISGSSAYANYFNGSIDIWTNDDTPLTVKFGLCDSEGNFKELGQNDPANKEYHTTFPYGEKAFSDILNGSMGAFFNVESYNNRFHTRAQFNNMSPKTDVIPKGTYFCIYVSGKAGQTVDMYTSNPCAFPPLEGLNVKANIDGEMRSFTPSNVHNYNNMACGENIISVGATVARTYWARLNLKASFYNSNYVVGDLAPFSSSGVTVNGLSVPTVVAPGAKIISSVSTPYVEALIAAEPEGDIPNTMTAQKVEENRTNYWSVMDGTSCSTPFVSGTIALWLQANPNLTTSGVLNILKNSSSTPEAAVASRASVNRWGYGLINGEGGVRSILVETASIGQVWDDENQRLFVTPSAGMLDVFVAGESALKVEVCDLQGRIVTSARGNSDRVTVNTEGLTSGVYIVRAEGNGSSYTRKLVL